MLENRTDSPAVSRPNWGVAGIAAGVILVIALGALIALMFWLNVGQIFK